MSTSDMDDNSTLDDTLGGRIVTARETERMTTAQLARRLGVKTETLSAWESDRSEPRPNQLVRISGMLNVSPTWLLTGEGESPSEGMTETDMMQMRSTVSVLRDRVLKIAGDLERLDERLATYQSYQD
ncbi:MAG: helix-turn-helix domain-containing protein [Woeseiaceae bacterium]|nr:helix-turn-helix domain-containing protein [Woeseiaceae bacterium]